MELLINNTGVDLFEEQEVVVQTNSPLVSFKLQGDKTYSFSVPNSDGLKKALGSVGHIQKSEVSEAILGKLRASSRTAIDGKVKVRKASDRTATLDVVAAPGGMDAKWWNSAVSTLDLGSDTFLTEEKTSNILLVKHDYVLEDHTASGGLKVTVLDALQYRGPFRLSFFDGSTQIFSATFRSDYGSTKRDIAAWVSECQLEFDKASSETMYFYATEKQISVMSEGMNTMNFRFKIENISPSGAVSYTYEVSQYPAVKYLSIRPGTRKSVIKNKPYFFSTIAAKNFYGEREGSFLAINQKDSSGELLINTQTERTNYPIVPCFRWKFIFEKISALMGFSLVESDWNIWKDFAVCSMVDMAQQCPTIEMPFNTYQYAIRYADYMPVGFLVRDMFDEFGLLTGTTWDFDLVNKQLKLIQIDPIFDKQPQVIAADALDLRDGIDYEDVTKYKLNYSTVIEAEKAIAPTGYFDDMPVMAEGFQLLNMKLLPLIPVKLFGNLIGSQCLSVGKSVFFDLKEQAPAARVFFYNAELERALTEFNGISLSRTDENGLYVNLWKRILSRKKGKKLTAKGVDSLVNFLKLDMFSLIYHRGVLFLINQKQIKLRNNRKVHDFEMEIEVVS